MKVGDKVTILVGKYEGKKGKVIATSDTTLTVNTVDTTGKKVDVTLYAQHVLKDK